MVGSSSRGRGTSVDNNIAQLTFDSTITVGQIHKLLGTLHDERFWLNYDRGSRHVLDFSGVLPQRKLLFNYHQENTHKINGAKINKFRWYQHPEEREISASDVWNVYENTPVDSFTAEHFRRNEAGVYVQRFELLGSITSSTAEQFHRTEANLYVQRLNSSVKQSVAVRSASRKRFDRTVELLRDLGGKLVED